MYINYQSGAVCLDGTPPAYYIKKGYGEGKNKWIIYMWGGGWCFFDQLNEKVKRSMFQESMGCYERSKISWLQNNSTLGTTNDLPQKLQLGGMFSDDPNNNAHFYNWNHIYAVYCDGFSFAGDQ